MAKEIKGREVEWKKNMAVQFKMDVEGSGRVLEVKITRNWMGDNSVELVVETDHCDDYVRASYNMTHKCNTLTTNADRVHAVRNPRAKTWRWVRWYD